MTRSRELAVAAAKWWKKNLEVNNDCFAEVLAGLIEEELKERKTISLSVTTKKADPMIRKAAKVTNSKPILNDQTMVISINPKVGILVSGDRFSKIHN